MNIEIGIDTRQAPDPIEPLGTLRIVDDAGGVIEQPRVWLDDWLEALVDGLHAMRRLEPSAEIELLSEPEPLVFVAMGQRIEIGFGTSRIQAGDADELARSLEEAIRFALEVYRHHPHLEDHEGWVRLRTFAGAPATLDPRPS
jgi:hypothetical protein